MSKVIVLGSLNMDLVMETNRIPEIGETLLGNSIDYFVGGKGANQAVAARRTGVATTLIGRLGQDTFGEKIFQHLAEEQIDLTQIKEDTASFTGIASIFKLPMDNAIVVLPGTNMLVEQTDISPELLATADVFLTQLEIPIEAALAGLKIAKQNGVTTILNPAPYHEKVELLLPFVDILTPNETEFALLIGKKIEDATDLERELLSWSLSHTTRLIITRGSEGVSYVENGKVVTESTIKVNVVDTTGAGDTFNGVLAAMLARGKSFAQSVKLASIAASLAVEKLGAQTAMPTLEEIGSHSF